MLGGFRQLAQLGKFKKMKEILEKERKKVEKNGVEVVVNGKMEIEAIKLNPGLEIKEQERILKDCLNEALKEIQKALMQEMMKKMF